MEKVRTVTVTVYTEDGTECGSRILDGENDETLIEEAREEADERYSDNIGNVPSRHRYILNINEFPEPRERMTTVSATLPEEPEDEPVTGTAS